MRMVVQHYEQTASFGSEPESEYEMFQEITARKVLLDLSTVVC